MVVMEICPNVTRGKAQSLGFEPVTSRPFGCQGSRLMPETDRICSPTVFSDSRHYIFIKSHLKTRLTRLMCRLASP